MKAVILAAGMGKRLGELTKDMPKCLLNFLGKRLIERQVENFNSCGIKDILVVAGYKEEKINIPDVKKVINTDYATTNMVESLFRSSAFWDDPMIVSYGDIIYERKVLESLISCGNDIGVVVDRNGVNYFKDRFGDEYLKHLESLKISEEGAISNIGEAVGSAAGVEGQYIGLLKFSRDGIKRISSVYYRDKRSDDSPWIRGRSFKNAYMTDMLQKMIDEGVAIKPVVVNGGWLEFDSVSDYNKYINWHREGVLKKYCNI